MSHFRAFEAEALRLLGTATLGEAVVAAVCRDAELVSFYHSGVGYFLTVRHHLLPKARAVLSQPMVLGQVGEVVGSYLAFVQDNELMLEYAGTTDVPEGFYPVSLSVACRSCQTLGSGINICARIAVQPGFMRSMPNDSCKPKPLRGSA